MKLALAIVSFLIFNMFTTCHQSSPHQKSLSSDGHTSLCKDGQAYTLSEKDISSAFVLPSDHKFTTVEEAAYPASTAITARPLSIPMVLNPVFTEYLNKILLADDINEITTPEGFPTVNQIRMDAGYMPAVSKLLTQINSDLDMLNFTITSVSKAFELFVTDPILLRDPWGPLLVQEVQDFVDILNLQVVVFKEDFECFSVDDDLVSRMCDSVGDTMALINEQMVTLATIMSDLRAVAKL